MRNLNGANKMKKAIEQILKSNNQLDDFLSHEEFHLRIENEPYIPLVIERHDRLVTVSHYFEQNGDLIADPDMEFHFIKTNTDWFLWPKAIQFVTGLYLQVEKIINGKTYVNLKEQKNQIQFANMWGKNILAQGFHKTPPPS